MSSKPAPSRLDDASSSNLQLVTWEFEPAVSAVIIDSQNWQRRCYQFTKRLIDILVSVGALVFGLPIFAVIALAVKITSRGPVFFSHPRLGRDGQEFPCYKFRTMVADAEQRLQTSQELREQFEVNYKLLDDPRITPLGDMLRRTSIDELPQFWNVLRGDMTLIGPRPIVPPELERYGAYGDKLLSVQPGLSGLWQTCGRSDTPYEVRIQLDMLYIDHQSTWLDLTLLFRTLSTVVRRAGAC